jgi:hypothetical protein
MQGLMPTAATPFALSPKSKEQMTFMVLESQTWTVEHRPASPVTMTLRFSPPAKSMEVMSSWWNSFVFSYFSAVLSTSSPPKNLYSLVAKVCTTPTAAVGKTISELSLPKKQAFFMLDPPKP